jgi:lipoprotein signal peptidase
MTQRTYRWLFWSLALIGLALDQTSKYGVFHWLYNEGRGGKQEVVPGAFRLVCQFHLPGDVDPAAGWVEKLRTLGGDALPVVNHGALWGLGGEYERLANGLFAGVSIVAALAIVWWSTRRSMARDWRLCAALGLILAGTLGNLYDRLIFHGVRDFLHFYWIEWPVFNVADSCLVCGAFLLLAQALWSRAPAAESGPAAHVPMTASMEPAEAKSA